MAPKEDLLAIAVGQVLDLSDQPAAARRGRELEARTFDALDRGLDPLHLVEQLLAALGLVDRVALARKRSM